jgi:hypothetical protein
VNIDDCAEALLEASTKAVIAIVETRALASHGRAPRSE